MTPIYHEDSLLVVVFLYVTGSCASISYAT